MGAIDTEFKRLHDVVTSLEERVKRLEQRQSGGPLTSESVRMILIGPPGAGTSLCLVLGAWLGRTHEAHEAGTSEFFRFEARIALI